jgi:hypothetical protein
VEPLRRVTRLSAQLARSPLVHRSSGLSGRAALRVVGGDSGPLSSAP